MNEIKFSGAFAKARGVLGLNMNDRYEYSCHSVERAMLDAMGFDTTTFSRVHDKLPKDKEEVLNECLVYYKSLFVPDDENYGSAWLNSMLGDKSFDSEHNVIDEQSGVTEIQALRFMMLCVAEQIALSEGK